MSTDEILDALFTAIEAGDIDRVATLYAPDATVWHNASNIALTREQSLNLLRRYCSAVAGRRYEILLRSCYEGWAVQRHVLHGICGEETLRVDVAIFFTIA